jgi:lysozyme
MPRATPLTQSQFDALVSLTFNIGGGEFAKSTLLGNLNSGDLAGAAEQFPVWNKVRVDGVLQVSEGLVIRRAEERCTFLGGC